MQITNLTIFALEALQELESGKLTTPEIVARLAVRDGGITKDYVAKVLGVLRKAGLVDSDRGPLGGYWLRQSLSELDAADVVDKLEGLFVGINTDTPSMKAIRRKCRARFRCSLNELLPRRATPKAVAKPSYLSTTQLAKRLGCSRTAVYQKLAQGKLPAPRTVGRGLVWLESDIEQWERSR